MVAICVNLRSKYTNARTFVPDTPMFENLPLGHMESNYPRKAFAYFVSCQAKSGRWKRNALRRILRRFQGPTGDAANNVLNITGTRCSHWKMFP